MNGQDSHPNSPQTNIVQQAEKPFWREVIKSVTTAIIVAALLAIPITKIGQWIVKTVVPGKPVRIETSHLELKFPGGNNPRADTYVKFDTPFTDTPKVNVHYTSLNQGVDPGRNLIFGVTAVEITPQGFHLTGTASYPGAVGTVEWLAFGN